MNHIQAVEFQRYLESMTLAGFRQYLEGIAYSCRFPSGWRTSFRMGDVSTEMSIITSYLSGGVKGALRQGSSDMIHIRNNPHKWPSFSGILLAVAHSRLSGSDNSEAVQLIRNFRPNTSSAPRENTSIMPKGVKNGLIFGFIFISILGLVVIPVMSAREDISLTASLIIAFLFWTLPFAICAVIIWFILSSLEKGISASVRNL